MVPVVSLQNSIQLDSWLDITLHKTKQDGEITGRCRTLNNLTEQSCKYLH